MRLIRVEGAVTVWFPHLTLVSAKVAGFQSLRQLLGQYKRQQEGRPDLFLREGRAPALSLRAPNAQGLNPLSTENPTQNSAAVSHAPACNWCNYRVHPSAWYAMYRSMYKFVRACSLSQILVLCPLSEYSWLGLRRPPSREA